jgi:hypothetical protein
LISEGWANRITTTQDIADERDLVAALLLAAPPV